jgi:nucleoside-diphosphate-sugar epimerase
MESEADCMSVRSSYNIAAISFSPSEIYDQVKRAYPDFEIEYVSDFRQEIADSWPKSIDDSQARIDWGWSHDYDLEKMTDDMILHLKDSELLILQ